MPSPPPTKPPGVFTSIGKIAARANKFASENPNLLGTARNSISAGLQNSQGGRSAILAGAASSALSSAGIKVSAQQLSAAALPPAPVVPKMAVVPAVPKMAPSSQTVLAAPPPASQPHVLGKPSPPLALSRAVPGAVPQQQQQAYYGGGTMLLAPVKKRSSKFWWILIISVVVMIIVIIAIFVFALAYHHHHHSVKNTDDE